MVYETVSNDWTAYRGLRENLVDRKGNILSLARQALDCSDKGFLTSVRVEVHLESEILRYVYTCARMKKNSDASQSCQERQTVKQESDDFYLPTLVRHSLRCEKGEGMRKFHMRGESELPSDKLWYNFSCCRSPSTGDNFGSCFINRNFDPVFFWHPQMGTFG